MSHDCVYNVGATSDVAGSNPVTPMKNNETLFHIARLNRLLNFNNL